MVSASDVRWQRGVIRPQRLHLQETEDGEPRVLSVAGGHVVNIAVCRAWTAGDLVNPAEHGHFERCPYCVQTSDDLHDKTEVGR